MSRCKEFIVAVLALHKLGAGYVVDSCGQLLPQGVVGELCLAGPQMAKEYWACSHFYCQRSW